MNFLSTEKHKELLKNVVPALRWNGEEPLEKHREACEKKLKALLGIDTFEKCEDELQIIGEGEIGGNRHIHFVVQTEKDYFVNCHLLLPKDKTAEPLPLCVALEGHVSGAHVAIGAVKFPYDEVYISHDVDFCVQAVKRGFAGLAIEQRGFGQNGGNLENGATDCHHAAMGAILLGRTLIAERVWDVQRVLDAVLKHFGDIVTMNGSILMGESGGGTATYYTACLEHRFDLYVPIVALCTFKHSIIDISHCTCNYIPNIAKYFDMGDLAILIAPKRILVFSTTNDEWFPLVGAKEAYGELERIYKAFSAEDKCKMLIAEGGHRFFAEQAWERMLELLEK